MINRCKSEWPQKHHDAGATVVRIIRASDNLLSNGRKRFEKYDLTAAEFDTLATLRKCGEPYQLMPSHICEANLLSSGGLTKVLISLEERKLIKRVTHPEDKRSRLVKLTAAGKKLIEQVMEEVLQAHENLLSILWTKQEREQFNQLMKKFHDGIENLP